MGVVKYVNSKSEAEILAMTSSDPLWYDQGFFYPNDKPVLLYYYRLIDEVMIKYADPNNSGVGVKLNDAVMGGVKTRILEDETLYIPENYDYNTYKLKVSGVAKCSGRINII